MIVNRKGDSIVIKQHISMIALLCCVLLLFTACNTNPGNGTTEATNGRNQLPVTAPEAHYMKTIRTGGRHTVGLKADGTVVATGDHQRGTRDVSGWTDIRLPKAKT